MLNLSDNFEKRNFTFNVIEGSLWMAGGQLMSSQTVLPALITHLGGGNLEIGVLGVIVYFALFLPQIFSSRYAQTMAKKKSFVLGSGWAQRVVVLLMGITVLFLGDQYPGYALWIFLIFFTMNQAILGINTPHWFDFLSKVTPINKRGILIGLRNSLAGILSLVTGLVLTLLLTSFHFPINYALAFFTTFSIQMIALGFQAQIIEEHPSKVLPLQPLKEYIAQLLRIVRDNRPFKLYLLTSIFLIMATMPMGFFTVYAIKHFGADEGMVGTFTLISIGGSIVGALVNGLLADRFGNKVALVSASFSMFVAILFALTSPSLPWFAIVFFGMGIFLGSELMIRYNFSIEYCHEDDRATYVGLMNTFLAPYYLCGFLGGVLSDMIGYKAMFGIGLLFSCIGIMMLIIKVHDPRKEY